MANEIDIGAYSAYAIAVKHGYEGTEAEFAAQLMNSAANGALAQDGAERAEAAAAEAAETLASIPEDYTELSGEVNQLSEDIDALFEVVRGINLFNPASGTVNGFLESGGTISTVGAYASYVTSDYIELEPGTYMLCFSKASSLTSRFPVVVYDLNKIVTGYLYNKAEVHEYTFTLAEKSFIRFSTYKYEWTMLVSGEEIPETYVEYVVPKVYLNAELGDKPKEQVAKIVDDRLIAQADRLAGKKWWACGDSFTEWTTETYAAADYPNINGLAKYKTYPFWIGTRTGMEVYNFAVSGQTMATPEDGAFTNAFSSKYNQIPDDVDYITLQFGINDSHHATGSSGTDGEDVTGGIPIGDVDDTTIHTFCGAYNVVLENLIRNHPFAKIGIIVSNGCDTDEYRTKTIQIAQKWGIPYIDLNGDERTPAMIRSSNPNVSSVLKQIRVETMSAEYPTNQHPNVAAHEYQSTFIEQFMRSL